MPCLLPYTKWMPALRKRQPSKPAAQGTCVNDSSDKLSWSLGQQGKASAGKRDAPMLKAVLPATAEQNSGCSKSLQIHDDNAQGLPASMQMRTQRL